MGEPDVVTAAGHGDRYLAPAIFAPLAQTLLVEASPDPEGPLLDPACGSGVVGRMAREQGVGSVTGLDLNCARLRVGASNRLRVCQGRAEQLPYRDAAAVEVELRDHLCAEAVRFPAAAYWTRVVRSPRG